MSYKARKQFNRGRYQAQYKPRSRHSIKSFDPRNFIYNASLVTQKAEKPASDEVTHKFSDFNIQAELKTAIEHRGFKTPTTVQDKIIPKVLEGNDVVGIANTGTGKTAAFLIPLINKSLLDNHTKILIVTPTRELAVQIDDELRKLRNNLRIYSAVCIGGANIRRQVADLSKNPQFVIGTPGRLLDLNNQHKINFAHFNSVVLDEVDRMLDMGFVGDIKKIISQFPQERQSLFFSATLDNRTKDIMRSFLKNPVIISIESSQTNVDIKQEAIKLNGNNKDVMLQNLLNNSDVEKALIFVRTKRKADTLSHTFNKTGFKTTVMHGNKSQSQRQRSLDSFRKGFVNILIATDVAARGIDVIDITHVINYDLPETQEDYIHRIGRTGRNGGKGTAISFIE